MERSGKYWKLSFQANRKIKLKIDIMELCDLSKKKSNKKWKSKNKQFKSCDSKLHHFKMIP